MFRSGGGSLPLLLGILTFIAAFAMALGPIPWVLCSEIFPTRIRGRAMSVATFVIWTACYVVAQTFPVLNDHPSVGPAKTFFLYAACSLAGFLFVLLMVPETKGKSLEAIEAGWGHKEVHDA
jgi:SP family arabinose:H+ symporter-like MFS transporter